MLSPVSDSTRKENAPRVRVELSLTPWIREAMRLPDGTDLADTIQTLNADLGLPANLTEMGVTSEHIPFLVEHAAKDVCTFTNAKETKPDDFARLYEETL